MSGTRKPTLSLGSQRQRDWREARSFVLQGQPWRLQAKISQQPISSLTDEQSIWEKGVEPSYNLSKHSKDILTTTDMQSIWSRTRGLRVRSAKEIILSFSSRNHVIVECSCLRIRNKVKPSQKEFGFLIKPLLYIYSTYPLITQVTKERDLKKTYYLILTVSK